ncbi:MAG TPA: DUF4440 domain-containing protein [Acidobacteriota bacterium]|nr:DUF4440 domain-containing protein [Acidobacteriota bacterium]
MKTISVVLLLSLIFMVSACAQKVDDPTDVQAIKKGLGDFEKAVNAKDANAVVAMMSDTMMYATPNQPTLSGKEAVRKASEQFFKEASTQFSNQVSEVRVCGNLALATGTWTERITFNQDTLAPIEGGGNWSAGFQRQGDGSWKWQSVVANSNRPLPGNTADSAEEQALVKIELELAKAIEKSDAAATGRFLAKEWTIASDGKVQSRAQSMADFKAGAYKVESVKLTDLNPHVFGDTAIVSMTAAMKGKYKGQDFPPLVRSVDFFVKREGRWQAVHTQNTTIK